MHDRFRMDNDLNLGRREVEQPAGFDQLEAFVEESGGIDGDLVPHPPGWMVERLGGGCALDLLAREGAERSAAGGEDDALDLVVPAGVETLEDGGVLGIDRQDG